MPPSSFVSEAEYKLGKQFKEKGYVIRKVTDIKLFEEIQALIAEISANILGYLAIVLAAINIFGGFLVTQRMLAMYKKKKKDK